MTTKTLNGSYPSGYSVQDAVTLLDISATASVSSKANGRGIYTLYGHTRSSALSIYNLGGVSTNYNNGNPGPTQGIYIRSVSTVTITNGSSANHSASISGNGNGVNLRSLGATVVNFGEISAAYGPKTATTHADDDAAIVFDYGGTVTNGGATDTGAKIVAGYRGVEMLGPGTVTNYGLIASTLRQNQTSYPGSRGVFLAGGGAVTNGSAADTTATIRSGTGVYVKVAAGTVSNFGAIIGERQYGVSVNAAGAGVALRAGGRVTNGTTVDTKASIRGVTDGVYASGANAYVYNLGQILGGAGAPAQYADRRIYNAGVEIAEGKLVNGSSGDRKAQIQGYDGVVDTGGASVVNYGAIVGPGRDGVDMIDYGVVFNANPAASIVGYNGVSGGSKVINLGAIHALGAYGYGVEAGKNELVLNGASGVIDGWGGVSVGGSAGVTVDNYGQILTAGGAGVSLFNGTLQNGNALDFSALIRGANTPAARAEVATTDSTSTNLGTIEAYGGVAAGVYSASTMTNGSAGDPGALIEGLTGVRLANISTLINFGTVVGLNGTAVYVGVTDSLVLEPGCVFKGAVVGARGGVTLGGGVGTISLPDPTTVVVSQSMPTTTLSNFGRVEIGPTAQFTLAGAGFVPSYNTLDDAGSLAIASVLDVYTAPGATTPGTLTVEGTLSGTGTLAILPSGRAVFNAGAVLTIATVSMQGSLSAVTVSPGVNLTYAGLWAQSAGTLTGGGSISFTDAGDSFSGTLAGTINFSSGSDTLAAANIAGSVAQSKTAALTLTGATTLAAVGFLTANGKVTIGAAGASLSGGTFVLKPDCVVTGATAAATLTNIGCNIDGAGALGGGAMTLVNQASGQIIAGSNTAALVIDTGANTVMNAGQIDSYSAGGLIIRSGLNNTGQLVAQGTTGGNLTVSGAVTGSGTVKIAAATADFASGFGENVTFAAAGLGAPVSGVLELGASQGYTGTVSGFATNGATSLDLDDIVFTAGVTNASFAGTTSGGVLTVTDGTHTAKISLTGDYTTAMFVAVGDVRGGTVVTAGANPPIHWASAVSDPFSYTAGWTGGVEPGPAATAILDAAGATAYTVTVTSSQAVSSIQTASTATLAVTEGVFAVARGTGGGVNAGGITAGSGAALDFAGSFANRGHIGLAAATLIVGVAGLTLAGTGSVQLSNSAANAIVGASSAATLALGQRLTGAGKLGGGQMTLAITASGVISANAAKGLIIDTGANTITNAGTILSAGAGGVTIKSAIANTGRLVASLGTLTLDGVVSGTGYSQINAGVLKAAATSTFNERVVFASGSTGTLELANSRTYSGTVSGFSTASKTFLDLDDITFTAGTTTASYAGGVLTVSDGTHTAHIHMVGAFSGSTWVLASDGHGGTLIHDPLKAPTTAPPTRAFVQAMAGMGVSAALAGHGATHAAPGDLYLSVMLPRFRFA